VNGKSNKLFQFLQILKNLLILNIMVLAAAVEAGAALRYGSESNQMIASGSTALTFYHLIVFA
jgi:hypothetical protein